MKSLDLGCDDSPSWDWEDDLAELGEPAWEGWCPECGLRWGGYGRCNDCPRCGCPGYQTSYTLAPNLPVKWGILKTTTRWVLATLIGGPVVLGIAYYIWRIIYGG